MTVCCRTLISHDHCMMSVMQRRSALYAENQGHTVRVVVGTATALAWFQTPRKMGASPEGHSAICGNFDTIAPQQDVPRAQLGCCRGWVCCGQDQEALCLALVPQERAQQESIVSTNVAEAQGCSSLAAAMLPAHTMLPTEIQARQGLHAAAIQHSSRLISACRT